MRNRVAAVGVVVVLLAGGSLSEGAEKKKGKTAPAKTSPAATAPAPGRKLPAGYQEVKTSAPELARAGYKIDGRSIMVYFLNLSPNKEVRIKYQVKWKKNENGKWVDDASMEGISFRLKKKEDLTREVRTGGKEIKDVVIDVVATETD
jgi:hypothetical protein